MIGASSRARQQTDTWLALPVIAGVGMLLLRTRILEAPDTTGILLLTAVFGRSPTSLLVPVAADVARMSPGAVAVVGLAGVALATLAAGRPVAAPLGAAALPLALFAAVAEEALFRRAAYGWLARSGPAIAVGGPRSCSPRSTCRSTASRRSRSTWAPACCFRGSGGLQGHGPSRQARMPRPTRWRCCSDEAASRGDRMLAW